MKRYSRRLEAFLVLGNRDNEMKSKQYQVTYKLLGHDEPDKTIHCVVEVIPGTYNGFECPICLNYTFKEEIKNRDGLCIDYEGSDSDKDFVDKSCRRMYNKGLIKFD